MKPDKNLLITSFVSFTFKLVEFRGLLKVVQANPMAKGGCSAARLENTSYRFITSLRVLTLLHKQTHVLINRCVLGRHWQGWLRHLMGGCRVQAR